jgi:hypothetical protein
MRRWHRPPLWTRLVALVLAVLPFGVLWLPSGLYRPAPKAAAAVEVRLPIARARVEPQPAADVPRADVPRRAPASRRPAPAEAPRAPAEPAPPAGAHAPAVAVDAPPPARPASAPLQLGADVIRAAARASRSETQRLAESAGVDLGGAPASPSAALSDAMAGSARPDCIAPDPQGNLLSAITLVFGAASGQCK